MDWLLATPQIYSVFSSLGSLMENTYVISPNAFAILDEINYKLTYEDQTLRTYRRAIGFGQNVREDLIPLLENAKDEAVLDSVIRILVNLTVPVECLFSVDVMYRTEVGRQTIYELNRLLYNSKEAFTDPKSTKSLVEYMKHILESDSKLSPQKCDQINNCLLLLRNILHIPESNCGVIGPVVHASAGVAPVSMQNTILWNLFIQSIDKLLLYLMTCPQRAFWGVSMVQLIALMYKDQHVSTLQKLLSMWFEASLSDSSEDNESNTSPPKQGSGDSSPMLTSDPTSDSSDNGGGRCKNDSCEDRRQALREETEATLQEVSRKGQAYQNSMLRVPAAYGGVQAAAADSKAHIIKVEALEPIDDEQCKPSHTTDTAPITNIKAEPSLYEATPTTNKQPAESANTTVATKLAATDAATFKSPTPLVGKTITSAPTGKATVPPMGNLNTDLSDEPLSKPCQKVPHSGQLILAKGKCCPQKRECPSSQSELSDCGYGTQVENQESISTSSNDDDAPHNKPQHQKPPCSSKQRSKPRNALTTVDTKELRRKKLVKRSKSSLINMKGLVQHTPTDEDISKILKEFTVDFLLKGYGHLVDELHTQLLANIKIPIDTSHFFWLVTYFLKFAAQLELDMEHISTVLTYDVISYLTYEGVMLCEQLELNSRQAGSDLKPYLRRMHLVVTAIREFLQAIETYKKVTHLSEEDQEHLRHLQKQISSTEDLRCLFVLLLRRFNPSLHTKQYLQDVVVTNHMLLLVLDSVKESDNNMNIKMTEHIAQFATPEVMHYYGLLLEDFDNNGEFVNDCIFTMMHHIGGDLGQIGTLFQPVILRTYSRIWEADYELCDDWSDLIEYVIHKFMNAPPKSPLNLPSASLTELTKEHNLENTVCNWTQEEKDTLYWYYVQSKKDNDTVGKIVTLFNNNGNKLKSRISIVQQLLQQDIITLIEYDDLMKFEDAEYQRTLVITPTPSTTESGIDIKTSPSCTKPTDDIQILRDLIVKQKTEKHLVLLQKLLLECCYVKTILKNNCHRVDHKNLEHIMEPVAYHCILKNKSIPVVEWNSEQATTMLYQPLVLLLHKLGFQLPVDAGSVFARIPDFWTIDTMFSLAKKLGPLDKLLIKFDVTELMDSSELVTGCLSRCHYQARTSLSSISSVDAENMKLLRRKSSGDSGFATAYESDMKFEEASDRDSEIFAVPRTKHSNSIIRFTPDPESTFCSPNWLQLVMRSKCNIATITSSAIAVATPFGNDADICMSSNHALSTLMTAATATAIVTAAQAAATTSHLMTVAVAAATAATTTTTAVTAATITTQHPTTTLSCPSISNIIGSSQMKQHSVGNNMTTSAAVLSEQQQQLCNDDTAKKLLECNDSSSSGYYSRSFGGNLESEYSAMVASVYENEIANSDSASVASNLTRMYVSDEEERHGN